MRFTFEEETPTREDASDDRRKLVAVPRYGASSRAIALQMSGIFIDANRNFADELGEELHLQPAPDLLDEVPDDEADLRTLERIYEKNPQVLAKFLASIGL